MARIKSSTARVFPRDTATAACMHAELHSRRCLDTYMHLGYLHSFQQQGLHECLLCAFCKLLAPRLEEQEVVPRFEHRVRAPQVPQASICSNTGQVYTSLDILAWWHDLNVRILPSQTWPLTQRNRLTTTDYANAVILRYSQGMPRSRF